jgi:hypothetical protein
MEIDYETIITILLWSIFFLILYFLPYSKYIYSVFDPIFTYVYVSAFSSVLIVYVIKENIYIYHYFTCQLFLFLGFYSAKKYTLIQKTVDLKFDYNSKNLLEITIYTLFAIYIIANFYVLYTRGAALFSEDPTSRETIFEDGFGIFRRINGGVGSFLCAGLIILYLTTTKRIYLILIIIVTFFTALEGTKSSLLRIAIIFTALIYHPFFINDISLVKKIKKYTPFGVVLVAFVFFFILAKESKDDIFLSFIRRLLYGADAVIYFYLPQNEYLLNAYHPLDFIPYIINPILGFLHLVPYVEPFGSITVGNTQLSQLKTSVYLAPNTPFYIEGQIFFGYYGAFAYSFFLGVIISIIRQVFFALIQGTYFLLALTCTFFFHSWPLVIETSLFVKSCLDTCIFVLPIYLLVCFIVNHKIVFRELKFRRSN